MSEKTEQPTPKRLREARERGEVPRSRTFSGALVLLGAAGGLGVGLASGGPRLVAWAEAAWTPGAMSRYAALSQAGEVLAWLVLPPLIGAVLAAFASGAISAGFQFHPKLLAPKLERVSPAE